SPLRAFRHSAQHALRCRSVRCRLRALALPAEEGDRRRNSGVVAMRISTTRSWCLRWLFGFVALWQAACVAGQPLSPSPVLVMVAQERSSTPGRYVAVFGDDLSDLI